MVKIKSIFKCDSCKTINPLIVLIEKITKGDNHPFRIEILILHKNDKEKLFFYESKKLTIQKRRAGEIKTYNYCGKCHSPIERIKNKQDIKFLRTILRQG